MVSNLKVTVVPTRTAEAKQNSLKAIQTSSSKFTNYFKKYMFTNKYDTVQNIIFFVPPSPFSEINYSSTYIHNSAEIRDESNSPEFW